MLLIPTRIGPSNISGIGLFASEPIKKHTLVWKYFSKLDIKMSKEEIDAIPRIARDAFLHYCYHSVTTHNYILCFDDARFINHSDTPNLIDDPQEDGGVLAARDICIDEELTSDYRIFDEDYSAKLFPHIY
jgi:SET domain-containing protein